MKSDDGPPVDAKEQESENSQEDSATNKNQLKKDLEEAKAL
jgi:hypothetical protein